MMDSSSVVISIPHAESHVVEAGAVVVAPTKKENTRMKSKALLSFISNTASYVREKTRRIDKQKMRRVIHSVKVGLALILVSLLYLLDPLYEQVGDNAMWAIMTVVVIFEFFAGATLGKGLNRGLGTILGGGLGCLAASFAQQVRGTGNSIIVGTSVFVFGAAATYARLVPKIKKRYDYGAMIFILTFNLVVVSGLRAEKVLQLARERLCTIGMGFAVCVFISLLIFPTWASDELHDSIASNFNHLARSLEGCLEEYFKVDSDTENQPSTSSANSLITSSCKLVLNSKAKDEQLTNFAKWEPWHGKFGLYYPWGKYLQLGDHLRELASSIISLKSCLQSSKQPSSTLRQLIREPCEAVGSSLGWSLKELGENLKKMKKCQPADLILPKLKAMRIELSSVASDNSKLAGKLENVEGLAVATLVFSLMEIIEKVEDLAKEVEELGQLAFR